MIVTESGGLICLVDSIHSQLHSQLSELLFDPQDTTLLLACPPLPPQKKEAALFLCPNCHHHIVQICTLAHGRFYQWAVSP